jgi:hypothetical protein
MRAPLAIAIVIVILIVFLWGLGCGGSSSTAPRPAASDAPTVLTPAQVAEVEVGPLVPIQTGGRGELSVQVRIAPGYHVMANPPSKPNYIPTRVEVVAEGVVFEAPRYPRPTPFRLWDDDIDTWEGTITIGVPFALGQEVAPGRLTGRVSVEYQACTEGSCLFPHTKEIAFVIVVEPVASAYGAQGTIPQLAAESALGTETPPRSSQPTRSARQR